jgi:hypothetical protein
VQDTLLAFGQLVVNEQENVRRVQLANEYLNSAALAGKDGSSIPEEVKQAVHANDAPVEATPF